MIVVRSISEAQSLALDEATVVSIGSFDGVHLGHQQLIDAMFEKNSVGKKVIITFSPHPAKVLSSHPPSLIFSEKDQIEVFSKKGIDVLFFIPFTREFANSSAEQFIETILLQIFEPKLLVVGYDFSFGKGKQGNFELLHKVLSPRGVKVLRIPPFEVNGVVVSSSKIRELITAGRVDLASELLGRKYYVEGVVAQGKQLGRKIGFPTVNLRCDNELYPSRGVYFCHTQIDGVLYKGVGNIGINPTTQNSLDIKVEFHILDYQGDLYGRVLRFELVKMLREERRFSSIAELQSQISKDVERARSL
jgi:riboflavin kinase / FMN adenylyltransferase